MSEEDEIQRLVEAKAIDYRRLLSADTIVTEVWVETEAIEREVLLVIEDPHDDYFTMIAFRYGGCSDGNDKPAIETHCVPVDQKVLIPLERAIAALKNRTAKMDHL